MSYHFKMKKNAVAGKIEIGKKELNISRPFFYKILEGFILTRAEVLGTNPSRDEHEFFVNHTEILKDPFDKDHIASDLYDGQPFHVNLLDCKGGWLTEKEVINVVEKKK